MGRPRRLFIALLLAFALAPLLSAQPARRVKDINGGGITNPPYGLTAAGNRLFFVADDGPHGRELWTSDGTGPGTARIPGTSGATQIMRAGTRVFFLRGFDLWVSDGTTGGTAFVAGLTGAPLEWADLAGILYFSLGNPQGRELWKSDGTAGGTLRVKEPDPSDGPRNVQVLVAGNGRMHFVATKSGIDALWSSDGTPSGTSAVMATPVRVALIGPPSLGVLGNAVVFCGVDDVHGSEPWVSDGTDAGTVLLRDIGPGPLYSSSPNEFVRSGALLFFRVLWQIWSTDGSPAGTSYFTAPPLDIVGGTTSNDLTDVGGRLCFTSTSPARLWAAGSPDSTILFTGLAESLTAVGSRLFFTSSSALAVSDLTATGTIGLRAFASAPTSLTAFAGDLYFFADDGVSGPQLWKSDGSGAGTELVAILRAGPGSSFAGAFVELGGSAFFLATSGSAGPDLWRTDGTEAGTTCAVQMGVPARFGLAATSRKLFWIAGSSGGPSCGVCGVPWLFASDGTQAGTAPVPGPSGPVVYVSGSPVAALAQVFFMGTESLGNFSLSLWRADGTAGALSLGPFPNGSFGPLNALHDGVVFLVKPSAGGTELWRSDGSPQGTGLVKTLSSRLAPDCVGVPLRLGRALVFLADDGTAGCNVWRSDGTPGGTLPVGLVGGGASAATYALASSRGFLVFLNGPDLWRTDGTVGGTFLLKTFSGNDVPGLPGAGTREGVYFPVQSNGLQSQLWLTDGKVGGTIPLHDFQANGENAIILGMTAANGRLLMTVSDVSTSIQSLWTSDGSPAGTVPVQQNVGASGPGFPYRGVTLFAGTDAWAGTEPWAMDGTSFAAPVVPTSLSLLDPCRVIDTRLPNGFLEGPVLPANAPRLFPVGGACGIPSTARALAANVTVTGATSDGLLRIHASDIGSPDASVINFRAGQTRANNATIALGPDAEFTVRLETSTGTGEAHVIVDVVGYYE